MIAQNLIKKFLPYRNSVFKLRFLNKHRFGLFHHGVSLTNLSCTRSKTKKMHFVLCIGNVIAQKCCENFWFPLLTHFSPHFWLAFLFPVLILKFLFVVDFPKKPIVFLSVGIMTLRGQRKLVSKVASFIIKLFPLKSTGFISCVNSQSETPYLKRILQIKINFFFANVFRQREDAKTAIIVARFCWYSNSDFIITVSWFSASLY